MSPKQDTKKIQGETVLNHEGGTRFYHRHLSPKAKARKKAKRKQARRARKGRR